MIKHTLKDMENTQMMTDYKLYGQIGLVILLLLFGSCKGKGPNNSVKHKINFHELIMSDQYEKANKLVDSLIATKENNGSYYFVKGIIQSDMDSMSNAIINYKKAYALNYKRAECIEAISFNEKALKIINAVHKKAKHKDGKNLFNTKKDSVLP